MGGWHVLGRPGHRLDPRRPLAEQAQGPFLNPLEQDNASPEVMINKVLASNYSHLFHQVCTDSDTAKRDPDTVKYDHDTDSDTARRDPDTVKHDHDTAKSYECIGRAIAAYERSAEVSQFTSKYDYWLKGHAKLTG